MKNIILQHYDGELGELERLSVKNITEYANLVGADYQLVLGKPFRDHLTAPCQKVIMLDDRFDEWDNVLMIDIDMFTPKYMTQNVFKQVGVGLHTPPWQPKLHRRIVAEHPHLASLKAPYWGGAIYKLSRDLRKSLRAHLGGNEDWMLPFNVKFNYEDEGIMHVLANKAQVPLKNAYIDPRWCQCSYLPFPETAGFVHVRTRAEPNGPHLNKIDNYNRLKARGVFA